MPVPWPQHNYLIHKMLSLEEYVKVLHTLLVGGRKAARPRTSERPGHWEQTKELLTTTTSPIKCGLSATNSKKCLCRQELKKSKERDQKQCRSWDGRGGSCRPQREAPTDLKGAQAHYEILRLFEIETGVYANSQLITAGPKRPLISSTSRY